MGKGWGTGKGKRKEGDGEKRGKGRGGDGRGKTLWICSTWKKISSYATISLIISLFYLYLTLIPTPTPGVGTTSRWVRCVGFSYAVFRSSVYDCP